LEKDLPRRLAAGDTAAYQEAYDLYGAVLFRTAMRLLGGRADAEDAVQEVFAALVRSRDRLIRVTNVKAYLFVSLRHVAGRMYRRQQNQAATGLDETKCHVDASIHASDDWETADRLWRVVASLPAEQRDVLALKIQGELTFKEIGAICGISANTAASRYRYALEKLKQMMEERP